MKNRILIVLLSSFAIINMSFLQDGDPALELVNTKWISPLDENCFESLCFLSGVEVVYYNCDRGRYVGVNYEIKGDSIKVGLVSELADGSKSRLVLYHDRGILRQYRGYKNDYPENFIKVPGGACD